MESLIYNSSHTDHVNGNENDSHLGYAAREGRINGDDEN